MRRAPSADTDRSRLRVDVPTASDFERFLASRLVHDLPECVVEAYGDLRERAARVPLAPKAIVTANAHWGSALVKTWLAEQTHRGAKLIVCEHGGSLAPYRQFYDFEEDIADVKCSWSVPFHAKHRQLPPTKLVGRVKALRTIRARLRRPRACSVIGSEQPRWVLRS